MCVFERIVEQNSLGARDKLQDTIKCLVRASSLTESNIACGIWCVTGTIPETMVDLVPCQVAFFRCTVCQLFFGLGVMGMPVGPSLGGKTASPHCCPFLTDCAKETLGMVAPNGEGFGCGLAGVAKDKRLS